jgi:hypothetical protein
MKAKVSEDGRCYMDYSQFKGKPGLYKSKTGSTIIIFEPCSIAHEEANATIFIRKDGLVTSLGFTPMEYYRHCESGKLEVCFLPIDASRTGETV